VDWLVRNHRDLIDAEFAINEGGGGIILGSMSPTKSGQRKLYQDFRLEVTNSGRPQFDAGEGQRDLITWPRRWPGSPRSSSPCNSTK
jgi:hypothetical protein